MSARFVRAAVLTALVVTLTGAPVVAHASTATVAVPTPDQAAPKRPAPVLPDKMHGRAAINALGTQLDEVEAKNHFSKAGLTSLLTPDHTAWLGREGQLFYQEDAPAAADAIGTGTSSSPAPIYPTTQTFALHSKPGSSRTIFLDFDGATVQNTAWNTGTKPITNGTHIGYDTDGYPSTFSTAEQGWIQEVWREVAESYAPFDVDVTTQDVGSAAWTRSSPTDLTFGTHVVITSSTAAQQQACGTCLGEAWTGVFDQIDAPGYYQPAWVFATNPAYAPMIIAQAAAHETGHTLGLTHDGTVAHGTTAASPYYAGTSAWGPVMGSSSKRAVTQFSSGEYPYANNTQDDLLIMQTHLLTVRPDDYGNTFAAPASLGAHAWYDASGVIGTRSDVDVFRVDLPCSTTLSANVNGIGPQSALDASLEVLNSTGSVIASSTPPSTWAGDPPVSSGMDAAVSVPVTSGTYYLRVDGVGNGSAASGGWSDYDSLGNYRLLAAGCPDGTTSTTSNTARPEIGNAGSPTAPPPTTTATAPATRPSAPRIGTASSGTAGGTTTATARWSPPVSNGGSAILRYQVRALRLNSSGRVVRTYTSRYYGSASRRVTLRLPKARYAFKVVAFNSVGASAWSRASRTVTAR